MLRIRTSLAPDVFDVRGRLYKKFSDIASATDKTTGKAILTEEEQKKVLQLSEGRQLMTALPPCTTPRERRRKRQLTQFEQNREGGFFASNNTPVLTMAQMTSLGKAEIGTVLLKDGNYDPDKDPKKLSAKFAQWEKAKVELMDKFNARERMGKMGEKGLPQPLGYAQ